MKTYSLDIDDIKNKFLLFSNIENGLFQLTYISHFQLKLECLYDIEKEEFLTLEGSIGYIIQTSTLTNQQKFRRCIEVIEHAMIDYDSLIKN